MKDLFKQCVHVCQLGCAYVQAVGVLVWASWKRLGSNGIQRVSFKKVGRKWYCEVPASRSPSSSIR